MNMTPYQKLREKVEVTGRCISCKRKAVPGNLRCQVHININRDRSEKWRLAHPTVRSQEKQAWRDQGRCELCPEHRKVEAGKLHCTECLERFRGYYETRVAAGMCARLGCKKKAGKTLHCETHRKEVNATHRYENFLRSDSPCTKLPSGFTLGGHR